MIILSIILIVLGVVLVVPILKTLGVVLLVIAAIFYILGFAGRPVGGRRYWY